MHTCLHSRTVAAPIVLAALFAQATMSYGQAAMELQISAGQSQSEPVSLSLDDLDALRQVAFETTTIWTDGFTTFSGVPLMELMTRFETEGETVEMSALNDYTVSMPIAEIEADVPIVATRMDGKPMSVRDKGPFWIVFPYDSDDKYQTEVVYSRSIWQLKSLKIVD